tara:strand:+ start:10061 stop:10297 length:237 start_codon:yes stop_codon:yes gene_type:complete
MSEQTPSAQQWIEGLAKELNLPAPSPEEIDNLLDLAGIAAHSSERIAAPIACWLIGLAKISPAEALSLVEKYESGRTS